MTPNAFANHKTTSGINSYQVLAQSADQLKDKNARVVILLAEMAI